MNMTLPTDSAERKNVPVYSGVIKYAPAALAGVARISKAGNDKHNPGEPLHHARGKSTDHADCIVRHVVDVADIEAAMQRRESGPSVEQLLNEASQMVWRALMWSQELHEKYGGAPLAPGARLPVTKDELIKKFLDSRDAYVEGGGHHQGSYAHERSSGPERLPIDPTHD